MLVMAGFVKADELKSDGEAHRRIDMNELKNLLMNWTTTIQILN